MAPALHSVADMKNVSSSLSRLSLLLSLLLLVPGVGFASQGSATEEALLPESSVPGTQEREPLRLDEDSWAREPQRPSRALRVMAELGAGMLTAGGGALVGFFAGASVCAVGIAGSQGGWFPCLDAAGVGMLLGVGLGLPLGVLWGGAVTGGEGSFLGALAGLGGGLVVSFLVSTVAFQDPTATFLLGIPLGLAGAVVGYELTDHGPAPLPGARTSPAVASARPRLQPVLAVSSRGALLGLGGSF